MQAKLTSADEGSAESPAGRPVRSEFVVMLVSAVLAAVGLKLAGTGAKTNFEDAALSKESTAGYASVDGHLIHCKDGRDVDVCLAGFKARGAARAALWLGNSQVHAVNQQKAGETNAPPILFKLLSARGLDLITLTQPNANLEEHYVLFEYVRHHAPVKVLILPAVFDDMREEGLREDVAILAKDSETRVALGRTAIGGMLLRSAQAVDSDNLDTKGISGTPQEKTERAMNNWLAGHSELWASRPELRGRFLLYLFSARNMVFGIKPTTKRKVIRGRYQANFAALEAVLLTAKEQGIKTILYIAPLRGGVEIPYEQNEYERFKLDVARASSNYGAMFANLETLVPDDLWGTKPNTNLGTDEELDFMHFQAPGHTLLARRLDALVAEALAAPSRKSSTQR